MGQSGLWVVKDNATFSASGPPVQVTSSHDCMPAVYQGILVLELHCSGQNGRGREQGGNQGREEIKAEN